MSTNPSLEIGSVDEQKKKTKFKIDPIENISFNGDYEETEVESESEEASSEEESPPPLKRYSKKVQKSPKKVVKIDKPHIVMNVSDTKYPVVKFVGKKICNWVLQNEPEGTNWDLFWTDNAVQPEQLGRMQPHQKINHFPGMYSLARKNHLGRNLMKMRKVFPDDYKFFPQTWLLPTEYQDFKIQFQKGKSRTFIIKPEASCQGRGIFLTRSIESISSTDHYVAQRYMHKPFLIGGLKFDLRIYVLLAGCEPMRIFMYKDGLVRFATEPYVAPSNTNLEDMCMHLTNYAINKDNPNFVFNVDKNKMDVGHKRGIEVVFEKLGQEGHDIKKLWHDIDTIVIKTISSVQPNLSHHYRSCQPDNFPNNMCFEILGFDIFLDNKLKPYLIEVNHTPSFTTDTPLDSHIKKNLIQDTFRLMNVNTKAKYDTLSHRHQLLQQRVLTGKKPKFTVEEKKEMLNKAQEERDEYESQHNGGYRKIYPLEDAGDYDKYIALALKQYEDWTGANIRRNTKKVVNEPLKPLNMKQKINPQNIRKLPQLKPRQEQLESAKDIIVMPEDTEEHEEKNIMNDYNFQTQRHVRAKPSRNQSREKQVDIIPQSKAQVLKIKKVSQTLKYQPQADSGNFLMPRIFEMIISSSEQFKKELVRKKLAILPNQIYPILISEQRAQLQQYLGQKK